MAVNEQCRHEGCQRRRGRYSVFCDEHHHEQLVRAGLARATPADPCSDVRRRCRQIVRWRDANAISDEEALSSLFDYFVHGGLHDGSEQCWQAGLDELGPDVVADLLVYARSHPEPRLFRHFAESGDGRAQEEQAALLVQDRLLRGLSNWLPTGHSRGAAAEIWYRDYRRQVDLHFTEEKLVPGSEEVHRSPSGKYRLVVSDYKMNDAGGEFTRGLVYSADRLVADVRRNYGIFHFGWAEGHQDGHDYLMCGDDYQGQTVVQLDTGQRVDYLPAQAKSGHGFCPAAYHASPDRRTVVIEGCYWACPYELVFCRFDDPLSLPWPILDRTDDSGTVVGWTEEGFVYESAVDVRAADGKAFDDLPGAEQDELLSHWKDAGGQRVHRWLRRADGTKTLLGERIEPA